MSLHPHAEDWYVVALLLAAVAYAGGTARLWSRAGIGRGISVASACMFAAGWSALALTVMTPLHEIARVAFSLHMVEHEILMVVAAPLLVLARPAPAFLWALGRPASQCIQRILAAAPVRIVWGWISPPLQATLIHAAALWLWHLPGPFQAALLGEGMHALQHGCFFLSALLFWNTVLPAVPRWSAALPSAAALFATSVHSSLLGALLTFSPRLWYPAAADPYPICGLTRWEDQQLAGLVMWVPLGFIYLAAALWLIAHWVAAPREARP
jgi:cytochrome c oxidase assembly factor CtaG